MDDDGDEQALPMKRSNVGGGGIAPMRYACAAKQIHRIPDAVLRDEAVDQRGDDHGEAAGDAAFDAAGDGISFNGQVRAVLGAETDALDQCARAGDGDRQIDDRDFFVLLVRQNLAKPSDAAGEHEHAAQNADAQRR